MQIHDVKSRTSFKTKKRVGRGGSRGKTSGKGTKGQKSRAGNSTRPAMRDLIKKIPKRRGYGKNRAQSLGQAEVLATVNVSTLNTHFKSGEKVTPGTLLKKGLIRKIDGNFPRVKILGDGEIEVKVICVQCGASKSALEKITRVGGTVVTTKDKEGKII